MAKAKKKLTKAMSQKTVQKPNGKPTKKPAKKALVQKAAAKKAPIKKTLSKASTKISTKTLEKINWSEFFTPLDDRVLIEQEAPMTKTSGGIFIPDSGQEKPNEGKVLAVGPGERSKKGYRHPLDVQLGDQVMFSSSSGTKLNLQGSDVILLKETDILAIR